MVCSDNACLVDGQVKTDLGHSWFYTQVFCLVHLGIVCPTCLRRLWMCVSFVTFILFWLTTHFWQNSRDIKCEVSQITFITTWMTKNSVKLVYLLSKCCMLFHYVVVLFNLNYFNQVGSYFINASREVNYLVCEWVCGALCCYAIGKKMRKFL